MNNFSDENARLTESPLSSREILNGDILHVFDDQVSLPNGGEAHREYIIHRGAVGIVPLTDDGQVILERQFRYPIHAVTTEIPAGKLDSPEEDRLEAAKRELREETGLTADSWTDLGDYYPSPAYSSERISLYLATGLHKGSQDLDEDEFLDVFALPLDEAVAQVLSGEITDGKTEAALLKAKAKIGF